MKISYKSKYLNQQYKSPLLKRKESRSASENITAAGIKVAIIAILIIVGVLMFRPAFKKNAISAALNQEVSGKMNEFTEGTPIVVTNPEDPEASTVQIMDSIQVWLTKDVFKKGGR